MTPKCGFTAVTLDLELEEEGMCVLPDEIGVTATATNHSGSWQSIDYWVQVRDPNGSLVISGPLMLAGGLVKPFQTVSKTFTHSIPDYFTEGSYHYLGMIGNYPHVVTDSTSVIFEVIPDPL